MRARPLHRATRSPRIFTRRCRRIRISFIHRRASRSRFRDRVRTAFTSDADFTAITYIEAPEISKVIHEAYVDVNDEATTAAAATGIVGVRVTAIEPARERGTGVALFAGRYVLLG